eukprot:TRINITY_DN3998_c0_g4_i3.p1 TRINITY_DN3998_c0_g4~~TRINITY_DN3998_c0_g4_i3.p1  ORF type:complete len:803 (+),score=116.19 TRINITY_DN3998_c0_g4_i3:2604-5012(+)
MGISDSSSLLDCPPSYSCSQEGYSVYENVPCGLGHYCPAGTSQPYQYPCPAGTFSNSYEATAESDCILCPRGYACAPGASIGNTNTFLECAAGHYCPRGTPAVGTGDPVVYTATHFPCPAGTYRSDGGARRIQDCLPCTHGKYCLVGTVNPVACPSGHYCPLGTKFDKQYPCKPGTYSSLGELQSQEDCTKCGWGHYCKGGEIIANPCPAGTYNDFSVEASECAKCPAGSKCSSTGTITPTLCSPGEYSAEGASDCTVCEDGYFCPEPGISKEHMESSFKCYAGMFCSATAPKDIYPKLSKHGCTEGKYCPEGTLKEIDCPPGTYNPFKGRESIEECIVTPAGHYTSQSGQTVYHKCDPGHFCLSGSSSATQYPCPAGTFRELDGGATPEDCATCWAGYKCGEGTVTPADCGKGYYCPLGTVIPEACPEGTYSQELNLYDSQDCAPCPAGKYCPKRGLTEATEPCDEGFYCVGGSKRPEPTDKITGDLCPKTGYCLQGAEEPTPCLKGTYVVIVGAYKQDQCVPCLAGYYCDGNLKEQPTGPCDPGFYCEAGEEERKPAGKEVGKGQYAPLGSRHPYTCPFGTFAAETGKAACDGCDATSVCTGLGLQQKEVCPKGYYCPAYTWFTTRSLTYDKYSCPQGTYNDKTGTSSLSDCLPCPEGKFCGTRAKESATEECAAGFYCLKGSPYEKPPKSSETDYGVCPPGYYCPKGTPAPVQCTLGTYSGTHSANFRFCNASCQQCLPRMLRGQVLCDSGDYGADRRLRDGLLLSRRFHCCQRRFPRIYRASVPVSYTHLTLPTIYSV